MPWKEKLPSGKYRACWRDDSGQQQSRSGFTQASAALRYAGEQEAKGRRGEITSDGRSPKWGDWCPIWLQLRQVEASTARQDSVRIKTHLMPRWGEHRLNRITPSDVQMWINDLRSTAVKDGSRPLSAATIDRIVRLFSASMKEAVKAGRLGANPCVGAKLPPAAPGHEHYLTEAEFFAIADRLYGPYRQAAFLLVGTGLRFGEMAGLHWNRVNIELGTITVVETWDSAAMQIKAYPKSKKPRHVPLPDWVAAELLSSAPDTGGCGLTHASGRCRSSLVVPAPAGGALDGHNFGRRDWADAVALSGVGPTRLHDLRHTYASWLVQAGVPLQEVQRLMGHASITTTNRYAHFGATQDVAIRQALKTVGQRAES